MASVCELVLSLQHRTLPGTLYGAQLNPRLHLPAEQFSIPPAGLHPWEAGQTLRAGVSAFGFGGTNAHAVLASPPDPSVRLTVRPWRVGRSHGIPPAVLAAHKPAASPPVAEAAPAPEVRWFEQQTWVAVATPSASAPPAPPWPEPLTLTPTVDPLAMVRQAHHVACQARGRALSLVTRRAVSLDGDPAPCVAAAAAAAYVAALSAEWAPLPVCVVDLPEGAPLSLARNAPTPGLLAWRAGQWHRMVLRPMPAPPF